MTTGADFESLAATHLTRAGLTLVARNRGTRFGELDLVMREPALVVFVEVRYRRSSSFGGAAASVDAKKQAKLATAAAQFLQREPALARLPCRFDVVAISGDEPYRIDWIRDAFRP
jgi:putative endonuclease